ncbi:MAG: ComEC/Rec2 family competence protein [Treponema sp.]
MNNTFCPAVPLAAGSAAAFYGLYLLRQAGYALSSQVFLGAVGLSVLVAVLKAGKQVTGNRIPYPAGRLLFAIRLVFWFAAGCAVGAYAELSMRNEQRPPATLAELSEVRTLSAELCAEPVPAGKDYYRVRSRILACGTSGAELYSASGTADIFLPAALIRAAYAGGITRHTGTAQQNSILLSVTGAVRAGEARHSAEFIHTAGLTAASALKPEGCRFYAAGLRMLVEGRFHKSGTVFYARPQQPLFLGWRQPVSRWRAFFRFHFMRLLYGWGEAGGLLLALLAADKIFLPPACTAAFRDAGLAHILALSGMHLSLIGAAALQSGAVFKHKKYAVRFSLAAVCFFVWFAGSAPSLNRALGMCMLTAAGTMLGVRPPLKAVLCMMLTVHIGVKGAEALTAGFMLSYGACAGIIVFGDACARLTTGMLPPAVIQSLSASIGAQLFTAPIVIAAIGSAASAGIVASCAVSPLASAFLITGLICIPLAVLFPIVSPLAGYILNGLYVLIVKTAEFFSRFPLITAETPAQVIFISAAAFAAGLVLLVLAARYAKQSEKKMPQFT